MTQSRRCPVQGVKATPTIWLAVDTPRTCRHQTEGLTATLQSGFRQSPVSVRRPPSNTLALYGANDTLVPDASVREAWRAMPGGVRRGLYWSGYHLLMRDKGRAGPIEDVLAWTHDPLAWLPSGADGAAASWWARTR